ncbi:MULTISPECIES: hypothetical protein [unclassified Legionella]|uniref:hypothetical protein n=1 Tax=unclassified Legionella TaxID=2622702 RepID=UPI0010558BD7|nr:MULTISPECIES: hypothetical protein [unclassified Legionella]MDI9819643.1 hypothetical protein [Legionella sp. PL877]
MDKTYFSPLELLKIATQHAYCAEHLLQCHGEISTADHQAVDALEAVTSLMHMAFELTFKAYLLHDHKKIIQHKRLLELLELNSELGLSAKDRHLLKILSRQQGFRKGIDYNLWQDRQQLHVFCMEIIALYEQLQRLMPIELQASYQSV